VQQTLRFANTWGGKRAGAGRKPAGARAGVPHIRRPVHNHHHPVHVTIRVRSGLPSLRSQSLFFCIRQQFIAAKERFFRIVHFSVQSNHIHMLIEADDRVCLARGMKGFGVRVARRLNGLLDSRGSIWVDRYHARPLQKPREVRNALVYVLFNRQKHGGGPSLDSRSSAPFFAGFADRTPARDPPADWPVTFCKTWLLGHGWKRHGGLLSLEDRPVFHR
jgi:REP element-mobilizing transposase RayT